jgi:hypothetical protein
MKILDLFFIKKVEDSKLVESFISKNNNRLITDLINKIQSLTEERIDDVGLRVVPFGKIYVTVLLYKPDYLFSDVRKKELIQLKSWFERKVYEAVKIIEETTEVTETTQASAIPNHAAKHVHVEPPKSKIKNPESLDDVLEENDE